MRIARKFALTRIGLNYETVEIEVEGTDAETLISEISRVWNLYVKMIQQKMVS